MIITRGYFGLSHVNDSSIIIRESYDRTLAFSASPIISYNRPTVFVSHKHEDLKELGGFLLYLKKEFNVILYIDSMDKGMPKNTCAETAERIKKVIDNCQKFILLGTNKALLSRWCNWEVGIADKTKLPINNMAILPMRDDYNSFYQGNEYLEIYPYIEETISEDGNEKFLSVIIHAKNGIKSVPLKDWLNNSIN